MGNLGQKEQWETKHGIYSNCKYFSRLMHRHRREGW